MKVLKNTVLGDYGVTRKRYLL